MSTLVETISEEIKKAMLAKDKVRLDALRGIKKEFLEALTAKGCDGTLSDEGAMKIMAKLVKQREESAAIYHGQNREDLAQEEEAQAEVIKSFLPAQLSADEIVAEVKKIVAELGVTDIKGMGRVMGVASKLLGSRADGKAIADAVKGLLQQ